MALASMAAEKATDSHVPNDLVFLSVASGYCDIVVTERLWRHMFNRGRSANGPERSY